MQPSQFDNLGLIQWVAALYCPTCNKELTKDEIILRPYYYDGYNWENPHCTHCDTGLMGLPVDTTERQIFLNRRPEKVKLLERIG